MQAPPIFVVGPHRAGSTLWHNVIALHQGILRLPEPRFMGSARQKDFRYFISKRVGDLSRDENVDNLVQLCFSRQPVAGLDGAFWRFENLGVRAADSRLHHAVAERIKKSDRSLGAIARAIIEELTHFCGCSRACVKFPVDIRHTHELIRWFPEARVVHITRDPRGLAMSKANDPFGTALKVKTHPSLSYLLRKAALLHVVKEYRVAAGMHERLKHISNYRLFRYEDLLAFPERTIHQLCDFIGIDFSPEMLAPERGQHEHQPSSLTGKQQKAFDPEAAVRWRKVISAIDNFTILALTKRSMKRLGYKPDVHQILQRAEGVSLEVQAPRV